MPLMRLVVAGLAWSGIWRERFVQVKSTVSAKTWDALPPSDETHVSRTGEDRNHVPWGQGQTLLPEATGVVLTAIEKFAREIWIEGRFRAHFSGAEAAAVPS